MESSTAVGPLVSVVMPAYKTMYLGPALESLQRQTYRSLELVVCDDCRDDSVEQAVARFASTVDFPVIYSHNESRLYETRSAARAIAMASGRYVKFLHDDDELRDDCIERLVAAMEAHPEVALASSRRALINDAGNPLPDTLATAYLFAGDVIVDGRQLTAFLAQHTINFIGEPSTVMCRRADLVEIGDGLSFLNGKRITWIADLALYVKLFRRGHLVMLAEPLTRFRISRQQFSQIGRDRQGAGEQAHEEFRQALRELGWCSLDDGVQQVDVAPLALPSAKLPTDLLGALQQAAQAVRPAQFVYDWLQGRRPSPVQKWLIDKRLNALAGGPRIAVLVVDEKGDQAGVRRTLSSLNRSNSYRQVEAYVFSTLDLLELARSEGAAFVRLEPAVQLAAVLSGTAHGCTAEWLLFVQAGDEFTPSGLLMTALELLSAPDCRAVYADAVLRGDDGELGVVLRPDFNLDLLLSCPASMARHWLYRRDVLLAAGGFDPQFEQALEFELQLRLIEQGGLGDLGHVSEALLITKAAPLCDNPDERRAIERHLHARGYQRPQIGSRWPGRYALDYGQAGEAGVSILIVAEGPLARLQRCVESLLAHTRYPAYEILLLQPEDVDAAVTEWLDAIEQMGEATLRVVRPGGTRAQCCNRALAEARGELLVFLSPAAAAISDDWLAQMVNHGLRPEVGIVGAKLLSPEGRIEHAGLLLGLQGPVGQPFNGETLDAVGYMNRLQVEQNYSAVSGDCMMIRRELFAELGGFDEGPLGARWGDLDLCLRVREAGLLTVWSPRVQLMLEATERQPVGVVDEDLAYERWLPQLAADPAYNRGFSTQRPFQLAELPLSWRPLGSWRPVPTVLAQPADRFGCGHYRVIQPFKALQSKAMLDGTLAFSFMSPVDLQRYDPDVVLLQRQYHDDQLAAMQRLKRFSRAFKVYELDDYLPGLPPKSVHREQLPGDVLRRLQRALQMVDRFVVSTPALADACAGFHAQIRVVENRLPVGWWKKLQGQRRCSARPRVGWAGGVGHAGDLELIAEVVKTLAREVDWVFFGMCPERLRPYVREFHPGVDIEHYPAALAALNLDLALAPLEQRLFNECKSNLRLLEYGACGFPVICSDVGSYRGDLPVTRVKNRSQDWLEAIRAHLADRDASEAMGDALRAAVHQRWMLEGEALSEWSRAWLPD